MFGAYSFGHITWNEKDHPFDLVVDTGGNARERGPRRDNHLLTAEELETYLEPRTKKLIVGTGESGVLILSEDAKTLLRSKSIECVEGPSPKAMLSYNREPDKASVTAIIHSTC